MNLQIVCQTRLAGDQRARRDSRHDSDAEDDDDVKKVCRPHLSPLLPPPFRLVPLLNHVFIFYL